LPVNPTMVHPSTADPGVLTTVSWTRAYDGDVATFPALDVVPLSGARRRLPDDLDGPTVVILAFHRWQQGEVDAWIEELTEAGCPHPMLEVPTIGTRYRWARSFIDGGMRSGIPDETVRRRTMTSYTDVRRVVHVLGYAGTEHVIVALVEPSGTVLAQVQGAHDPASAAPFLR
jgi:hypothetical protein